MCSTVGRNVGVAVFELALFSPSAPIMKISVLSSLSGDDGNINILELPDNESSDILTQIIAAEVGIPIDELLIHHYGQDYTSRTFPNLRLSNDDIITVNKLVKKRLNIHDIPASLKPEELLKLVNEQPHLIVQFENNDLEMANALKSNDIRQISLLIMSRQLKQHKVIYEQREEEAKIFSNPDSEENQRKIEEKIRKQNIQSSMETAMEEIPESFGVVQMLYINIELNGMPIKAFVDSGAQSTIMSAVCAERCGLTRLIDPRFAGQARGVGTAPILGRIHLAQMKIQSSYYPISITVLQGGDVDFLFGLDMLRRHQCCIDLKHNVLRVEGASGIEECPFLSEDQIPKKRSEESHLSAVSTPKRTRGGSFQSDHDPFDESMTESLRQSGQGGGATSPQHERRTESGHFVNSDIIHLCSLGFSIIEASNALSQTEGDVELAAQLLFSSRT
jgi:DNA damage-inducible protein 1